jgi:hypothetical protein
MDKRKVRVFALIMATAVLLACSSLLAPAAPTPIPGLVETIVAATANAAATQTAYFAPTATNTPTLTPLPTNTPTITPTPTATFVFILFTYTPTMTNTPNVTPTVPIPDHWPDWKAGTVVSFPSGSGENIGTTKFFSMLKNVEVVVTRENGVKVRDTPNKAYDSGKMPMGTHFILTGYWNKNSQFGWSFVKVRTVDNVYYWVGGDEGSDKDPQNCLVFYHPPTITPTSEQP